eukprot:4457667-Amphidinium_carterae.1
MQSAGVQAANVQVLQSASSPDGQPAAVQGASHASQLAIFLETLLQRETVPMTRFPLAHVG